MAKAKGKKSEKKAKENGKDHFRMAIIDIGSNSVRLVALKIKKKHHEIIENNKHICELGQLDDDGNIPVERQELAFNAFDEFAAYIQSQGIDHVLAVATAAARNAGNGRDFIEAAKSRLGHDIKILTAQEEAKYAALGVIAARTGKANGQEYDVDINGIVADLGGGSLELARVTDNNVEDGISTKLGTLVLRSHDDPTILIDDIFNDVDDDFAHAENLYVIGGSWRAVKKTWEMAQISDGKNELPTSPLDTPFMRALPREAVLDHLDLILSLYHDEPLQATQELRNDIKHLVQNMIDFKQGKADKTHTDLDHALATLENLDDLNMHEIISRLEELQDHMKSLSLDDKKKFEKKGIKCVVDGLKDILKKQDKRFPDDLRPEAYGLHEFFPDLRPDRANKIFDASILLKKLIEKTDAKTIVFAESGLREGLIYHYIMQSVLTLESSRYFFQMHTHGDERPMDDDGADETFAQERIPVMIKPEDITKDA